MKPDKKKFTRKTDPKKRTKNNSKNGKGKLLSQIALEKLKEAIIENQLAPGQEVTESQLAERFDMGKAPIRFALATLTQEGLVNPQSRRGYVVAPLTMKDIHDVWAIRQILEQEAVRLAAGNIDRKNLEELDKECKKGYTPGDSASLKAYISANKEFHLAISRSSGNQRLTKIMEQQIDHMTRMLFLGVVVSDASAPFEHGHSELVAALDEGDGDKAAAIVEEHLKTSLDGVLNAVMQSTTLMEVNLAPRI